ncbi:hypothetical protein Agub_g5763, partial [Astrephomene gubernaculifera]
VRRELRRRAAAAGLEGPGGSDDPEWALEEEVQEVGERLDWWDLAVSLGAVRRLGATCQAVLGPRHWATNRCRYTVLELCTAALNRTTGAGGSSRGGGAGSVFGGSIVD